jgi:hypothetical protein
LNWKFSSIMMKHWIRFYLKSLILVHFSALELKIFFNYDEKLNEILPANPSFWYVLVLLNWNFSSTMVKNWIRF